MAYNLSILCASPTRTGQVSFSKDMFFVLAICPISFGVGPPSPRVPLQASLRKVRAYTHRLHVSLDDSNSSGLVSVRGHGLVIF